MPEHWPFFLIPNIKIGKVSLNNLKLNVKLWSQCGVVVKLLALGERIYHQPLKLME